MRRVTAIVLGVLVGILVYLGPFQNIDWPRVASWSEQNIPFYYRFFPPDDPIKRFVWDLEKKYDAVDVAWVSHTYTNQGFGVWSVGLMWVGQPNMDEQEIVRQVNGVLDDVMLWYVGIAAYPDAVLIVWGSQEKSPNPGGLYRGILCDAREVLILRYTDSFHCQAISGPDEGIRVIVKGPLWVGRLRFRETFLSPPVSMPVPDGPRE